MTNSQGDNAFKTILLTAYYRGKDHDEYSDIEIADDITALKHYAESLVTEANTQGRIEGVFMMQPQPLENHPFNETEERMYKKGNRLRNMLTNQNNKEKPNG